MNKHLYRAAFVLGLLAIGWVAAGYLRSNPLALAMMGLILGFYLMGALELQRFHQASAALGQALASIPQPLARLDDWLARVPASLQHAVRQRIEGGHSALPGPAMAPYLAGLLVLLGMLGTFLGMVLTLNGTGAALEHATDLATMRESLAAPVRGLGLAFGTSVAGVAASAMLGLMSALCRRERLQAAQALDSQAASTLHAFTQAHQRQASFGLLQQQAQWLPALADQLQALMAQLATQARLSAEQQLASQQQFQGQAEAAYQALAASVGQSLQQSLGESARIAAATIGPAVQATMSGITRETAALHGHIAGTVQQQLDGLSARFASSTQTISDGWASALAGHDQRSAALALQLGATLDGFGQHFEQRSAAWLDQAGRGAAQQSATLLQALHESHAGLQATLAARDEQRLAAWADSLAGMAAALQREWQQAGAQTLGQQTQITETLALTAGRIAAQAEAHARGTIAEIGRLVQAASEAPRAAADLVAQLRDKLSDSLARDNAMLDERQRIMATLNSLLDAVQHSAAAQQASIDQLVAASTSGLQQAGTRFTDKVDAESARLETLAAQLGSSAAEVASLGEAFGAGVELFSQSGERLMAHLQRIDETLAKSMVRSDEQLAYYVAQAREVIDLSLMSQKQVVDDLQRIAGSRAAPASAVSAA